MLPCQEREVYKNSCTSLIINLFSLENICCTSLEFDFTGEALAAFDADNAYIQGFADGMIFMGLFKKV